VKKNTPNHFGQAGFTLIELLVVVSIIAILAALLLPVLTTVRRNARESTTRSFLKTIETACAAYEFDFGFYPPDPDKAGRAGVNKSSESLTFHLSTPFRIIGTGAAPLTPVAPGPNAKGERWATKDAGPYMELPEMNKEDVDADSIPEVVDIWKQEIEFDNIRDDPDVDPFDVRNPHDPRTDSKARNLQGMDIFSRGEKGSTPKRPIANFKVP